MLGIPPQLSQETHRVQPSASPDLPHTRARSVHWLATAVALTAVLAGAALLQPPDASAGPSTPTGVRDRGPDPTAARYPLDCGSMTPEVLRHAAVDFDGDRRAETVAVVRCPSGMGTPPSGVYVLAPPPRHSTTPRIVATLVDPQQQMSVSDFSVRGRTIGVRLLGYSSSDVPRCCPDLQREVEWDWRDGRFELTAAPLPGRA